MHSNDLITEIECVFSPSDSAQVLAAIQRDPLVWKSLEQVDFQDLAFERVGNQVQGWCPGQLALLALGESRPAEAFQADPMQTPGQALQEHALQAYQATQRLGKVPATLQEAGLLALALRERRRLTGTWNGLLQELLPKSSKESPSPVSIVNSTALRVWRTPLACLYSLIPDPVEMLKSLLVRSNTQTAFDWVVLTVLSQPTSQAEHVNVFAQVLKGSPVSAQLHLMRSLSLHGEEEIAAALANILFGSQPAFAQLSEQISQMPLDLASLSSRALTLQQMGAFYQVSGQPTEALSLYDAAEETLQRWLAGLYLQRLNIQVGSQNTEPCVLMRNEQISHLADASTWLKDDLGVVLMSHPYASCLLDQIPPEAQSAFLQLKRARQLLDSDPVLARESAHRACSSLIAQFQELGTPYFGDFVFAWHPEDIVNILLEMTLPEDALTMVNTVLEMRPTDCAMIHIQGKIYEQTGRLDQAIQAAQHVAALDPQNVAWFRWLGNLWESASDWEQAFQAWEKVLALTSPTIEDCLACAKAALHAGHPDRSIELCNSLLQEDANNGATLGMLGQALAAKGDAQQAINNLVRATLLAPEMLQPWLALASVQQDLGEPQRALETLRSAVTAVPEAAEGHLALGEACIASGLLAEALPHLKKSFAIDPNSTRCALVYARTLRELGHPAEARLVLEQVRFAWITYPELAYEYAQDLLDLDDAENALPVLEAALKNGLPVLEGYLLYAKILLGEYRARDEQWDNTTINGRMQQADQALHHILEIDPNNLEARFLMADILRERGDLDEALIAYRALADSPDTGAVELRWRVQYGLGRTALCLGQVDTALVALKEACQAKPDQLPLLRTLAEASLQAALPKEAIEASSEALHLAPDDIENITWFADLVTRAGEPSLAVEAMESAVQLEPDEAALRVNLAVSQLAAGDLAGAKASLASIETLPYADRDGLRRAAQVYLRIEDTQAALACFERAMAVETPPPADLLYEVAQLQNRLGNYEAALELAQQALADTPENLPVHLLQADLLVRLSRPQAALAVLEHALRVAQNAEHPLEWEDQPATKRILGEIHERFTALMLQAHDLPAALQHAEQALSLNPTSVTLCYQAADLALAQLQTEYATRILDSFPFGHPDEANMLLKEGQEGVNLLSLKIEMALDHRQDGEAATWIKEVQDQATDKPRLLAAWSRLLMRQNDLPAAHQTFEQAWKQANGQDELWLAEAALETQHWQNALETIEAYAQTHLYEARAQLAYARMLVVCAEQQRLCEALNCRTNAPGASMLSETNCQKFEDAIHDTMRLVNMGEVGRWQARGQAVFTPSQQSARVLASMPALPDDTAALISLLRQLNNRAAAIQVARRHAGHPLVMLHQAMCCLGDPSPENIQLTEDAVVANPNQPLAHVILARVLEEAGELNDALHAYENALKIWPDEPAWHDSAGDLCIQIGDLNGGIAHRREALSLDPQNAEYAFKLGQACLAGEDVSGAVNYLEQSLALDPEAADVWLALASAYQMAGRLSEAMEASKKVSELNPTSAQGLLIAGETALSMKDADLALTYAQSAIRREPENASVVLFLSHVLVQLGQVEEGLQVLEEASPAVKAVFPVAFERGKLVHRLHGPEAALEILEKLEKDNPEEPELLGYLAHMQAECGDFKAAERYAFKALKLNPHQADLNLMLGRLQRKSGQLDQAVYLLSEAVRMDPHNLDSYLELASVYEERREYAQAIQMYHQAMQIAPDDYQAYYQCGLILRDSKDYSGAEAMLRRAADLAPDNLIIRRQLVGVIAMNLVHHTQEASVS